MFNGLGYEKAKALAKKLYSKIKVVYCPLLEDNVYFTSEGFNHLIRKGNTLRTKGEQKRRFALIPFLPEIICDPKADIHYDDSKPIKFWTLVSRINDLEIIVTIHQVHSKKKFLSVYASHNKKSHKA